MGGCFAIVQPDELKSLEWMGKFNGILGPGLHFFRPFSETRTISTRVMENKVVTETKTKDNVFVQIHIAVQQEVRKEKAFEAIYKLSNPAMQIESFVSDVVRGHAPHETLDDLFVEKEKIALDVKQRLSGAMEAYGYNIHQVLVIDIVPDNRVKAAMNQINASKRLRQAAEEKAEADKVVVVKAAEADADSKFLQGQGIARSRAAIVDGLREAVCGDQGTQLSPKEVSDLLLMTQYLDTLERVAAGKATTIFVPQGEGSGGEVRDAMLQASFAMAKQR